VIFLKATSALKFITFWFKALRKPASYQPEAISTGFESIGNDGKLYTSTCFQKHIHMATCGFWNPFAAPRKKN
jgi:hypothetical protein